MTSLKLERIDFIVFCVKTKRSIDFFHVIHISCGFTLISGSNEIKFEGMNKLCMLKVFSITAKKRSVLLKMA